MNQMLPYLASVGAAEGIKFKFGGNIGNTINSHRLVEYAKSAGKQDQIINQLFKYFFEEEKDITDLNILADAGADIGLDRTAVLAYLQSNKGRNEVNELIERAYQLNISGVPYFIVDNKYAVSGAQNPEYFLAIFKKLGLIK